jgi:ABC-2 type transport system ATP-binding protein
VGTCGNTPGACADAHGTRVSGGVLCPCPACRRARRPGAHRRSSTTGSGRRRGAHARHGRGAAARLHDHDADLHRAGRAAGGPPHLRGRRPRVPAGVSPATPAPGAVLATNGFGGDKDGTGPNGNGSYAARFAEQGYVTLSYSGLGFGGSGATSPWTTRRTTGRPDHSSSASSAGRRDRQPRRCAVRHRRAGPARRDRVRRSRPRARPARRHGRRLVRRAGAVAIAGIDPRVDALAPTYTWNDLAHSLSPNAAGGSGTAVTSAVPGHLEVGLAGPVLRPRRGGAGHQPGERAGTCGGYVPWICQAVAEQATLGYPSEATVARTRAVSVGSCVSRIQGPGAAVAGPARLAVHDRRGRWRTYDQLRRRARTVRMVWQSWGHTAGDPVPGELDTGTPRAGLRGADRHLPRAHRQRLDGHWLKDVKTDPRAGRAVLRDWRTPRRPTRPTAPRRLAAVQQAYAGTGGYRAARRPA